MNRGLGYPTKKINRKIGQNQTDYQKKPRFFKIEAFSCLHIGDPPRGRTENLLIKSQAFFVHRRA